MGSHVLEILRQGLWASLTGGWFYDPRHGIFCNTFHLYLWMFLLCFPFTIYLTLPSDWTTWGVYCAVLSFVFVFLKFMNHRLHYMFDTGELVEESVEEEEGASAEEDHNKTDDTGGSKTHTQGETTEGIELTVLSTSSQQHSVTPPVQCSSRASVVEGNSRSSFRKVITPASSRASMSEARLITPVDSMEYINRLIKDKHEPKRTKDLKVDVHWTEQTDSLDSNGLDPIKDVVNLKAKGSHSTKDVTAESLGDEPSFITCLSSSMGHPVQDHDLSSTVHADSVTPVLSRAQFVDETTRHTSPSHRIKSRRHRKAVRRTKSAMDDAHPQRSHSMYSQQTDPREPQGPRRGHVMPSDSGISRFTPRQYSLPANACMGSSSQDPSDSTTKSCDKDDSSLSSYKETSPEYEHTPSRVNSRVPRQSREVHPNRARTVTPNVKSQEAVRCKLLPSHQRSHSTDQPRHRLRSSDRPRSRSLVESSPSKSQLRQDVKRSGSDASSPRGALMDTFSSQNQNESCGSPSADSADDKKEDKPLIKPVALPRLSYLEEKSESSQTLTEQNIRSKSNDSLITKQKKGLFGKPNVDKSKFRLSSLIKSGDGSTNGDSGKSCHSQQSSTVGLDWLFSTDTDSVSSADSLSRSDFSDSLSTLTNDEAGTHFDSSPERLGSYVPGSYYPSAESRAAVQKFIERGPARPVPRRPISHASSSSASPEPDYQALSTKHTPGGNTPGASTCRHRHKGTQLKEQATNTTKNLPDPDTDSEGSVDLSVDLADTVELSKRLLEIISLNDPQEAEVELKKLKDELNARKERQENMSEKGTPSKGTPAEKGESSRRSRSRVSRGKGPGKSKSMLDASTSSMPPPAEPDKSSSSRESSASNHNENSALIKDSDKKDTIDEAKDSPKVRSGSASNSKRNSSVSKSGMPPPSAVESLVANAGKHLAMTHDDTTEGAVHCFQDEFGNWYMYAFGEDSVGIAQGIMEVPAPNNKPKLTNDSKDGIDSTSISSGALPLGWEAESKAGPSGRTNEPSDSMDLTYLPAEEPDLFSTYTSYLQNMTGRPDQPILNLDRYLAAGNHGSRRDHQRSETSSTEDSTSGDNSSSSKPNFYYKYFVLPKKFIKVHFDRLALVALLDKNTVIETILSILLAVGVGVLGSLLLSHSFYQDFWIFVLCFVMASCQYSLLKSVQPDAASPMHGYNRAIVFSRPFYFCICATLLLGLHYASQAWSHQAFSLYGLPFTSNEVLMFARDFMKVFILFFPLIFTIGLLPQVNTFLMYVLEQVEIHIFGGNATTSLGASLFTVLKSCFAVAFLYGFCYAGIKDPPSRPDQSNTAQHVLFSVYCGVLVPVCYHLSRCPSHPGVLWQLIKRALCGTKCEKDIKSKEEGGQGMDLKDPLPEKLRQAVYERLRSDLIVCCLSAVMVFAISVSTVFSSPVLQPNLFHVLAYLAGGVGLLVHYLIPMARKEMPWLCCAHPILSSYERSQFEVGVAARVMWFEKLYCWLRFLERNLVYPALFLNGLTSSVRTIITEEKFGLFMAALIIVVCSIKMFRSGFADTPRQYLVVVFTTFFFQYDYRHASATFLIDYFFMSIVVHKAYELWLKLKFILTYIAPWQITWGSAFHAFAQPFSVPHSAMLFLQAIVSTFFSTPLNPLLGSAIFLTSYVRPVKFWERDYNTKRVDHTNTRLSSQLERNPGADDNNLNSIFYEHLTRSLQHSICGDLFMGRWGSVSQGDCFIMASDYLNALVHVIEMGNGLVTFQLRGLEFRGTYCQQREVEAITEGVADDQGFCCCESGHLPHFLSLNAAFSQRWLAWEVVVTKYILEGYSISDNSGASMLQVFDLRKVLITYFVKSIIYYTVRSPKLSHWLENEAIREGLEPTSDKNYVDLDPTFTIHLDEDYDSRQSGVSRNCFCNTYHEWIQYCASRRDKDMDASRESWVVSLCYGLSLLGRRALGSNTQNSSVNVDFFLYRLHALFKGDFRINTARDEWVFSDMELIRRVVAPGVRMSLKLHQDHFTSPDEYDDHAALYDAITNHEETMVISHEADPTWRNAVLSNVQSLLALRHVFDEGSDEYKVIMLNKRYLSFRVIKVNRECVRGLWAGQLQELIFLRNRNPERGSIQNAKQALRNMINSSCDQPIGYPIYVSPLTTSYSGTNEQYSGVLGKEFSLNGVYSALKGLWHRMRARCGAGCTSSGSMGDEAYRCAAPATPQNPHSINLPPPPPPTPQEHPFTNRGSLVSTASSASKPSNAFISLAGLIGEATSSKDNSSAIQRVQITDPSLVFDNINQGRRIDPIWPNEEWRSLGGKTSWGSWVPERNMEGSVVHRWQPCHRDIKQRSHVDHSIILVHIGDRYVPIAESGVRDLGAEV